MFTKAMAWAAATWESGQIGMLKVLFAMIGVYIIIAGMAVLIITLIFQIDKKYAWRIRATGTAARKYLEIQTEDGSYEAEDSEEGRRMSTLYVVSVYCSKNLEFTYVVEEALFDQIKIGDQIPITYEVRRLFGSSRLVEVMAGRHQSERLTDDPSPP